MIVTEREVPPQEGEILYDVQSHLHYKILKHHGEGEHFLLGFRLAGPHYTIQYEDGLEHQPSLCQMYYDKYIDPSIEPWEEKLQRIQREIGAALNTL